MTSRRDVPEREAFDGREVFDVLRRMYRSVFRYAKNSIAALTERVRGSHDIR